MRARHLALAFLAACSAGAAPPSASHPSLEQPGSFVAPDQDGAPTTIPRPGARATILDFWATWCDPCRRSVPALARAAEGAETDGIELVLVGVLDPDEPIDAAAQALQSWGAPARFVVDRGGGLKGKLGIGKLPATLILDRAGTVRWVAPAGADAEAIVRAARRVADAG